MVRKLGLEKKLVVSSDELLHWIATKILVYITPHALYFLPTDKKGIIKPPPIGEKMSYY